MKIATSAYPIDWLDDWQAYDDKITRWVEEAAGNGADLLVFPEYGAMELASLGGKAAAADLEGGLRAVADRVSAADELHDALAKRHGVHILAASAPVWDGGLRPVNRARFFGPSGPLGHQDKQIMTRFERDPWNVVAGGPLTLFDTALGKIGVLICYDCEFPLLARALIDAGAEILLAPSCTEAHGRVFPGPHRCDGPRAGKPVHYGPFPHGGQCALVPCGGNQHRSRCHIRPARYRLSPHRRDSAG